jgi:hypothetical protein
MAAMESTTEEEWEKMAAIFFHQLKARLQYKQVTGNTTGAN